jgi:hypothetical protein
LGNALAAGTVYAEIPIAGGGTMIAMPGGGCMVSDGPVNAMTPMEKRIVRYTDYSIDGRCPK